ncbi:MAG: CinA family nicotinamide mononucleotide deamidase-related protein [Paludibacteraceae bacterium]|nr:CinA family nicotinamide mononucleotide deamidase-related protein [Paludibacteraceae bacterium]
MKAEIITIGDELLIGQVVDTNSAWMAERLNEAGIELYQITSVHDDREHILKALDEAFSRADIVLTTGGLGPTKDDITKHVMCEYFGTSLVEDASVRAHIHELYKERPEVLNRLTATQWLVPASATILPNRVGSAPIMVFENEVKGERLEVRGEGQNSKFLIAMPGVPHEMKIAMTEQVMPYIRLKVRGERLEAGDIIHRTILLSGIAESTLAIRIEDWENALPDSMHLAYLPKDGTIRLRLSTYGEATAEELQSHIDTLLPLISDYLLATEDISLEALAGRLLKQHAMTIATAESCTGGRLAAALNVQSGSSAYYMGSVVAYDNRIKEQVLGVAHDTLMEYGAVSEQTVREMAEGVRTLMNTDYAIATSGIAGPTGGTKDKPVGTVWIAWATPTGTEARCFHFGVAREREQITMRAVNEALIHLIKSIKTKH